MDDIPKEIIDARSERDAYKRKLEDLRYFLERLAHELDYDRMSGYANHVWKKLEDETSWQI
jgi:hypothetical protein